MDDDWFASDSEDLIDEEDEDVNLDDYSETCDESGSNYDRDEISVTSDDESDISGISDYDSETTESSGDISGISSEANNTDEDETMGNSYGFEDFEDDGMLSFSGGGSQSSGDFDEYGEEDNNSESSYWSDIFWNRVDLWQTTEGRDSSVNEEYLGLGQSTNVVGLLCSKEMGIKSNLWKARLKSFLLAVFLRTRWSTVSQMDMLKDAILLLGRSLYPWEGRVLKFLRTHSMKGLPKEESSSNPITQVTYEIFVPVTFADIISALVKSGVSLLATDERGQDLLIHLVEQCEIHEDSADFIELLIKQGLNVGKNEDRALRTLCDPFGIDSISNSKLRTIKMILDAGLNLSKLAKRTLVDNLSRHLLDLASESAVKIVKLLLSHGCQAKNALINMKSQDCFPDFVMGSNGTLHFVLEIAMTLLENGARVNSTKGPPSKRSFVSKMLDVAAKQPNHPSMLPLLEKCIQRGINLRVTSIDQKNLLMDFCAKYKHEDLPDIIRLLCTSGIDVNQVDVDGKNALIYLSFNYPIHRKSIYDAACALLELNIDPKRIDSKGSNALLSFLKSDPAVGCCTYNILKLFNESKYWETLDLLLDTGIDVNQTGSDAYNSMTSFLLRWSRRESHDLISIFKPYSQKICEVCLDSDFPFTSKKNAMKTLDIDLFKPVLRFVDRLLEAGADTDCAPLGYKSILHYVCCCFEGELLIALVSLLCKTGVDANSKKA